VKPRSTVKYRLRPDKPPRLSAAQAKKLSSARERSIDYSEIPEISDELFKHAVRLPEPKQQITLRIDRDVLRFFRRLGRGYQSRINSVLRRYVDLSGEKNPSA
jgi:uncharacterized protein (DUF4415 family)